jgi:hypothetical protein
MGLAAALLAESRLSPERERRQPPPPPDFLPAPVTMDLGGGAAATGFVARGRAKDLAAVRRRRARVLGSLRRPASVTPLE